MITEIEVDSIGMVRQLNAWEIARVKNMPRVKRGHAMLAFACGMSLAQWRHVPADKQEEIRRDWLVLIDPRNVETKLDPRPTFTEAMALAAWHNSTATLL